MPVTTLHKLIGLSVAMLGQAPGTDLLQQWTRLYTQSREDGLNAMAALQKVAQHILDSAAFEEVHPPYTIIENQDFAQRFLDSVLGETASAEVVALVVGLLDGGTSRAEVAVRAVEYLLEVNHQGSDHADYATFGTYALRFGNQVEVARYYTVDKKWMTPDGSVLTGVDDTAASVTAAKGSIDGMKQPGKNFTLTTGVDQFTGTPGDDTFVATESTLNGADRLHGKEGMDTLELSSGSGANDDISIPVGATVEDIETLSVTSDGKFTGDVSQWTGLETVQLEVVKDVDLELDADAAVKVMSDSLGDDEDASEVTIENAGMVALKGVSKHATAKITGEGTESVILEGGKSVHVNTKASPSTTVNSVKIDGVARNNGEDGKRDGTTGAGTAAKDKDKASVEVYSKALANIALHNTDAIVLFRNDDDDKDLTGLTAMVNRFGLSASMMGKLCLQGIEDLMLQVAGDSWFDLASNEIKSIDVSGAGDLTLDVNQFDNSKASTTLESLMLSGSGKFTMKDASGLSKLKTIDAGDATGDVSITKLGNGVTSYTGSSGKDMISVAAFNSKGLMANLGAGDDTFTVDNAGAGNSKIDGGEGMDTLVLKQDKGANLKGAGDAYINFETITLEAGGGSGKYDLKGLAIDKLMISKTTGSGGVTFDNVTPGMGLSASSPAKGKNVAVVNYMVGQVPRFSNSSTTLNLQVHATGHQDDTKDSGGGTNYIGGGYSLIIKTGSNRGVGMTLTVDEGTEQLIIDTSAKLNGSKLKAADYVNRVRLKGGKSDGTSEIEYIKVVGDASIYLESTTFGASGDLSNLKLVDLTEVTGIARFDSNSTSDVKVMGGDGGNAFVTSASRTDVGNHELIGGKLPDVILGGRGNDKITGGGGGDVLGGYIGTNTYIYNAAEDSQVRFDSNGDPASGFDTIAALATAGGGRASSFTGALFTTDKIDLRKVVELQGDILRTKGSQDGVPNNGNPYQGKLSKYLENYGDGLFETDLANRFQKEKHTIFVVETAEVDKSINGAVNLSLTVPDNPNTQDAGIGAGNGNDKVTWILVDVDGDGDFDAGTDMAIATIGWYGGAITRDDFVT